METISNPAQVKIQFQSFLKKVEIWVSVLLIDALDYLATPEGHIWKKTISTSVQDKIQVKIQLTFFLKEKNGFPCWSTHEDFSIDATITNVGLILTKLKSILF